MPSFLLSLFKDVGLVLNLMTSVKCFRGRPHSATSSAAEQEDDTIIKSLSFINDEHLNLHQAQVSWYRRVSTVAQRRPNPHIKTGLNTHTTSIAFSYKFHYYFPTDSY